MYAIKSETKWGVSWVRADETGYRSLGKLPSLFAMKSEARSVIAQYKQLSANSGKAASPMKIVCLGEV